MEATLQVTEQSRLQEQDPALTANVSLATGLGPHHFQEHDEWGYGEAPHCARLIYRHLLPMLGKEPWTKST